MIRSLHAELLKLRRPSILYGAAGAMALTTLLTTALIILTAGAEPSAETTGGPGLATSLNSLALAGGLTRGFTIAAGFLGLVVFVLFLTSMTGEYGQGTIRTLLTRQPNRVGLLAGKLAALLGFTAVALLAAEVLTTLASIPLAHLRGIPTGEWFTGAALSEAAGGYANALLTAGFYGGLGIALAVLVRSTPLALGIGIAWLGPLEHIIQLSWSDAARWFPGLLYDTVAVGGNDTTSYQRAVLLALAATAVALAAGTVSIARRDVTA
jgi:ABC-2 type transport system permease protein